MGQADPTVADSSRESLPVPNKRQLHPKILFPLRVAAVVAGFSLLVPGLGYLAWSLAPAPRLEPAGDRSAENTLFDHHVPHHSVSEWPEGQRRAFIEAPLWQEAVRAGQLPPVEARLPETPLVIHPPEQEGPYGGTWDQFATGPADINFAFEGLLRWDPHVRKLLPNLATHYDIEDDGRTFILHLRRGVRWSDGHPFTAEDLLFWHEVILVDRSILPLLPSAFLSGGEVMEMEKIDDYTVRCTFNEPHGLFPLILAPLWEIGYMVSHPAHYLRQFHPNYTPREELETMARREGFAMWNELFLDRWSWRNPDCPRLEAWVFHSATPGQPVVFRRNPYYWKVDPEGRQLPYIDYVRHEMASAEIMNFRFIGGRFGMQAHHIDFRNLPLFLEHRKSGRFRVVFWENATGTPGAIMMNMTHRDPILREIIGDRRFRIALSHAINRQEINEAFYFGLGEPMQLAPHRTSLFYKPRYALAHTEYNPERANHLLDQMGLEKRDERGIRLRPDGEPLRLEIEFLGVIADLNALLLVADHWREVGIDATTRERARDLYYKRMPANLHDVTTGGNNAMDEPLLLNNNYFVPTSWNARHALEYSQWYLSNGERGTAPPPEIAQTYELYQQIQRTVDPEEQQRLAHAILEIYTENRFLIGILGNLPRIVLVKDSFRNVPTDAFFYGRRHANTAPECYAIADLDPEHP